MRTVLPLNPVQPRKVRPGFLGLLFLAVLLACGGGGGGSSSTPPPATTAPAFTTQPASVALDVTQTATFTVAASGNPAPTFLWQRSNDGGGSWADLASGAAYTTGATASTDTGAQFRAVASNSAGSATSSAATLTVNPALAIAASPSATQGTLGQSATLTVTVTGGTAPLTYQWRQGATTVGGDSATLTLSSVQAADAGSYTVLVTDSAPVPETVTSASAILSVATGEPLGAVLSVQQLVPVTNPATLTPAVSGGVLPYTYAWSLNGTPLASATGPSFTIPSLRLSDQGSYQVQVTDYAGTVATTRSNLFVATTAGLPTGLNPVGVAATASDIYLTSPGQNLVLHLNRYSTNAQALQVPGGPTGVALDAAGNLWLALNTSGQVAMLSKATAAETPYSVGGKPYGLILGANDDLWFTVQGTDQLGHLPQAGGAATLYSLSAGAKPAGLCLAPDGSVWFTEPGLGQVGRLAPGASGAQEWSCPNQNAHPVQILATSSGQVFYTDQNSAAVVMFTVASQAVGAAPQTGALPASARTAAPRSGQAAQAKASRLAAPRTTPATGQGPLLQAFAYGVDPAGGPAGIAQDAGGNVWLTQQNNGKVTQLDPSTGGTYVYALPSSQSQPSGVTVASDGSVYVALPGTDQIAQIPPAPTPITVTITGTEPHRELNGGTDAFTATVTGATTDATVTWSLLEGAAAGTIDQTGAYTATTTPGIYHVLATSNQDPSVYGRLELLVYPWTTWPTGSLVLFAGNVDGWGSADGTGSAARFNDPAGLAMDTAGNLYLADLGNDTIRKITPAAVVSTPLGAPIFGSIDGTGPSARFNNPAGVAVDASGKVWIADSNNDTIRVWTAATGFVSTVAGLADAWGATDGTGMAARFNSPYGLAVDASGTVFVADTNNHTIRKITPGGMVTTLSGLAGTSGTSDGSGGAGGTARFNMPCGMVLSGGSLFVADLANHAIRQVDPATGAVTTLAGLCGTPGYAEGTGTGARFEYPRSVAADSAGNLYVTDSINARIRKVTAGGTTSTLAGSGLWGYQDGPAASAQFMLTWGIAVDPAGTHVYVADYDNVVLRLIDTATGMVSTFAGKAQVTGAANGAGAAATFDGPWGMANGPSGSLYVADYANAAIRVVDAGGNVTTPVQGVGTFGQVMGVAVLPSGNLVANDFSNEVLWALTPSGGISLLAGQLGTAGAQNGQGTSAGFDGPQGITADASGHIYVADELNCTIRQADASGNVSTLAGLAGYAGVTDGSGASARFTDPQGVAISGAGDILVADTSSCLIRVITPGGVVTTLAGTPAQMGNGDGPGTSASFYLPFAVTADGAGNVYVADTFNNAVRVITPSGFVGTLLGDRSCGVGRPGSVRDGSDLPLGSGYGALSHPYGILMGQDGALYITTNNGIMRLTFTLPQ